MNKINFKKEKIPYTQVANEVLNDKNISFKAKGLYAYLYSKPEGWDFAIDRISLDTNEGRKSVNSGLQELEQQGYLIRERQKTGRVIYLLKSQMSKSDIGVSEPNVQNGKVPKRQSAETGTVSNKDTKVIKSISNKDIYTSENFKQSLIELGVTPDTAEDFMQVRKKKKGSNTQTALNGIIREVKKTNLSFQEAITICCERDWKGFKAEWLKDNNTKKKSVGVIGY